MRELSTEEAEEMKKQATRLLEHIYEELVKAKREGRNYITINKNVIYGQKEASEDG